MNERHLRFPALLLVGLAFVACGGGGDDPAPVETPDAGHVHEDADTTDNKPPTAVAGQARVVPVGSEVQLDGTESSDPDGDLLSFEWTIASKPSGSEAALNNSSSRTPRFTADKAGEYEIELSVSDDSETAKDIVVIRANTEPIANAGVDQTIPIGEEVILNGSESSDPDGDALTHSWVFISRPDGSEATLKNASGPSSSFNPDVIGLYTLELTVSDGHAEAKDRINVNVTLESGVETSILHISPSGDDANEGSAAKPLRTIAKAFEKAAANEDIKRFVLASGTYEEAFGHELSRAFELVGPAEGEAPAILRGTGDLFTVKGEEASLTLLRVKLESENVAVHVYDKGSLSFTGVECEAKACIRGTDDDDEQRPSGVVSVSKSWFAGLPAPSSGIALQNGSLTIADSTVGGFKHGINLMGVSIYMQKTWIQDNEDVGLSIVYESSGGTVIEESVFVRNKKGLYLYSGGSPAVSKTSFDANSERGIEVVQSSGLSLDEVDVTNGAGVGIYVNNSGNNRVVRLRNSKVTGHGSHGIEVVGKDSKLDLGTGTEAGNNEISHWRIIGSPVKGWNLYDGRPANATGAITLSHTKLQGSVLTPGTYAEPHCDKDLATICIVNTGNTVTVH